jgi:hypothetical protein
MSSREASRTVRSTEASRAARSAHCNRLPFEGVLTIVDVASDKSPSGARGHRVILTREAAENALPSLIGMAVNYRAGWEGHDARQKVGVIESAGFGGKALHVGGYLFARDFPEIEGKIDSRMGMSYELADAHVADMRSKVWTLTRATFTGAAILLREKAAYRRTSFCITRPGLALAAEGMTMRSIVLEEADVEEEDEEAYCYESD